eukprot:jgi/Mesvir1/11704/Mv00093-RA.1
MNRRRSRSGDVGREAQDVVGDAVATASAGDRDVAASSLAGGMVATSGLRDTVDSVSQPDKGKRASSKKSRTGRRNGDASGELGANAAAVATGTLGLDGPGGSSRNNRLLEGPGGADPLQPTASRPESAARAQSGGDQGRLEEGAAIQAEAHLAGAAAGVDVAGRGGGDPGDSVDARVKEWPRGGPRKKVKEGGKGGGGAHRQPEPRGQGGTASGGADQNLSMDTVEGADEEEGSRYAVIEPVGHKGAGGLELATPCTATVTGSVYSLGVESQASGSPSVEECQGGGGGDVVSTSPTGSANFRGLLDQLDAVPVNNLPSLAAEGGNTNTGPATSLVHTAGERGAGGSLVAWGGGNGGGGGGGGGDSVAMSAVAASNKNERVRAAADGPATSLGSSGGDWHVGIGPGHAGGATAAGVGAGAGSSFLRADAGAGQGMPSGAAQGQGNESVQDEAAPFAAAAGSASMHAPVMPARGSKSTPGELALFRGGPGVALGGAVHGNAGREDGVLSPPTSPGDLEEYHPPRPRGGNNGKLVGGACSEGSLERGSAGGGGKRKRGGASDNGSVMEAEDGTGPIPHHHGHASYRHDRDSSVEAEETIDHHGAGGLARGDQGMATASDNGRGDHEGDSGDSGDVNGGGIKEGHGGGNGAEGAAGRAGDGDGSDNEHKNNSGHGAGFLERERGNGAGKAVGVKDLARENGDSDDGEHGGSGRNNGGSMQHKAGSNSTSDAKRRAGRGGAGLDSAPVGHTAGGGMGLSSIGPARAGRGEDDDNIDNIEGSQGHTNSREANCIGGDGTAAGAGGHGIANSREAHCISGSKDSGSYGCAADVVSDGSFRVAHPYFPPASGSDSGENDTGADNGMQGGRPAKEPHGGQGEALSGENSVWQLGRRMDDPMDACAGHHWERQGGLVERRGPGGSLEGDNVGGDEEEGGNEGADAPQNSVEAAATGPPAHLHEGGWRGGWMG